MDKLKDLYNQLRNKEGEVNQLKDKIFRQLQFSDHSAIIYPGVDYICLKLYINQLEISVSFRRIQSITQEGITFDRTYYDYDSIRVYNQLNEDITNQLVESNAISNPEGFPKTSESLLMIIKQLVNIPG